MSTEIQMISKTLDERAHELTMLYLKNQDFTNYAPSQLAKDYKVLKEMFLQGMR